MCLLGWFQHWVILYPKPNEKLNCVTVSFALTVTHGVEQRWHALQRQYGDDYWRTRSDQGQLPAKREVRTMKQTPEVRGAQYVHYKWLNKGFLLEQRQNLLCDGQLFTTPSSVAVLNSYKRVQAS